MEPLKPKSLVNKIVHVTFYDHAKDSVDLIRCEQWGRVIKIDELNLVLCVWDIVDQEICSREGNAEYYSIGVPMIIEIDMLRSSKKYRLKSSS